MTGKQKQDNYLWRGGERIKLVKEEDVFTAVIHKEAENQRMCSLPVQFWEMGWEIVALTVKC